ncbi:MAG TPA: hypothetical protein VGD34_10265 [Kribbella sp.]|jgi:hypothetical protein
MKSHRLGAAFTAAALTVSVVACSGSDNTGGLPSIGQSQSSEPSSSGTPSTTPTATKPPAGGPTRTTDRFGGLTVVVDQTIKPTPESETALKVYVAFQRGFASMLATRKLGPELQSAAAGQALTFVQDQLRQLQTAKERVGGSLSIETDKAGGASKDLVVIGGCWDQSKLWSQKDSGQRYYDQKVKKQPRLRITTDIVKSAGVGWRVGSFRFEESAC